MSALSDESTPLSDVIRRVLPPQSLSRQRPGHRSGAHAVCGEIAVAVHPDDEPDRAALPEVAVGPDNVERAMRAAVSEKLGPARFRLWFGESVRMTLSGQGDALEVRVPDPFFREWIQGHYTTSLLEAAQAVLGRPMRLTFEVRDEAEPPLGDVVAPPRPDPAIEPPPLERTGFTIPAPSKPNVPVIFPAPDAPGATPGPGPPLLPFDRPEPSGNLESNGAHVLTGLAPRNGPPVRRLEDFVTGTGNRLAHAAATAMAHSAGRDFNPLVIHGAIGLGKTHLLEGVGHSLRQAHPKLNVAQLTAEGFTNNFLEAMRSGNLTSFRNRYRTAGGLIVDDVHFLAAKRATQEEFLHTFNALIARGAPIVLAADQHPRLITRLTDELVTRFLGGMVVKIDPPDLATRRAILHARALARGVHLPESVVVYIAEHLHTSVRELEGALNTVVAQALLTGKRLDLALAQNALRDTIRHTAQTVGLRDVERAVCQLFQITPDALKSESRTRALAYPRMLAMYLARKHVRAGYAEIGRFFGGRNHSTVISAERKVETWLRAEQQGAVLPGFETVADVLVDLERTLGA